jgi:hypothetical protein
VNVLHGNVKVTGCRTVEPVLNEVITVAIPCQQVFESTKSQLLLCSLTSSIGRRGNSNCSCSHD